MPAVSEVEDRVGGDVHAGVADRAGRVHRGGPAHEEDGQRDPVDPAVKQRAAAQRRREPAVIRRVPRRHTRHVELSEADLADRARHDQLFRPPQGGNEARAHRLHQEPALAAGGAGHPASLGRVDREGLLAHHRLAGVKRADRPLRVKRVRQPDVDHVDLRVRKQQLEARVTAGDAVLVAKGLGALGTAPRDGHERRSGNRPYLRHEP